jgi:hypothetical protein
MRNNLLLILIAGSIFTAFALQWSFHNGRLTRDPGFDDVLYFVDGLERAQVFYAQGFEGLLRDLSKNPPHSPWSTGLAFLSFLILGVHDWAPYLANGILVVLFLGLSLVVARANGTVLKVLIVCFACSFPWAVRAVQDFRPDFAVALFTAGGVLLAIPMHRPASYRRETKDWLLLSGLCFAMAFITKPSFVLHTLLLYAYSATIVVASHFPWRESSRPLGRRLLRTIEPLLMLLVPVVCVAVPYYALDWQHVTDYIWSNTRGDKAHLWRLPTSYIGTMWFYLAGPPAREMMKSHLLLASCLVMLGFAIAIARKEYHRCWYALLVLGAAGLSLVTLGIARIGNPFFGLTSQLLGSLLAIYFIGSIWNVPGKRFQVPLRVIAIVAVLVGIAGMLPNPATDKPLQTPVNAVDFSINRDVVQTVHGYARDNDLVGTEALSVLVAFAGDVNDVAMTWFARKAGLKYHFYGHFFSDSIDSYINASKTAAFLVVADPDVAGVAPWILSNKIADQILNWVRAQSDWSLLRAIEAYDGLHYFIFVNSENVRPFRNPIRLGARTHGFLAVEGAYPDGLRVVRWGIAPESTTVFSLNGEEKRVLELSARSIPGQTLTVLLNGSEQQRHTFKTDDFEDIVVPLAMKKGDNQLTLRYTTHLPVSADNFARAVLFRKILLLPEDTPQARQTKPEGNMNAVFPKFLPTRSHPHTAIDDPRAPQTNAQYPAAPGPRQ